MSLFDVWYICIENTRSIYFLHLNSVCLSHGMCRMWLYVFNINIMQINTFINDNIYDKQGETIMSYTINYFMTNLKEKEWLQWNFSMMNSSIEIFILPKYQRIIRYWMKDIVRDALPNVTSKINRYWYPIGHSINCGFESRVNPIHWEVSFGKTLIQS